MFSNDIHVFHTRPHSTQFKFMLIYFTYSLSSDLLSRSGDSLSNSLEIVFAVCVSLSWSNQLLVLFCLPFSSLQRKSTFYFE